METKSTDKRLLVVGGRGWVGSEFVQVARQLHRFSEILSTSRDWGEEEALSGVTNVNLNLKDSDFSLPQAEYLVYCAGSVPQSGETFDGSWQEAALEKTLEQFFSQGGERAFVSSSGAVYEGLDLPEAGFEESQWTPALGVTAPSEYAQVKQKEEVVAENFRNKGHAVSVGRLFAALGTRFKKDSQYAFVDFIQQQTKEGAIRLRSPESKRSFIWLPELALSVALWLLDGKDNLGTFNVTGRSPVTLRQLALGLFPEASLIEGNEPARDYFGSAAHMLSHSWFSDVRTSGQAIKKAREELGL